jgi:hypothetical protein
MVEQIAAEFQKGNQTPAGAEQPVPVVVQAPSLLWQLPVLLEPLATAGLVIALVIFMLLEQGDLRNRLIRLVGSRQLTLTTRALDEAGQRISRYLLMHSLVNGTYGVTLGLVLWLIGLPHALLWGVLAAVLRFIPYVGPAVSALFPAALSLGAFPGWTQPLLVIGFIVVLELLSNMIMEPLLYGRTAGVSEVALMVAVAFWTWLWGPIGLLLATPLTVSLGVLGRYMPQLEFLGILVSDEPILETHTSYYQRLVARDQDEAADLVEEYLQTHTLAEAYDDVLIPALSAAKKDYVRDNLSEDEQHFIVQATRDMVEDLGLQPPPSARPEAAADSPLATNNGTLPLSTVQRIVQATRDMVEDLGLQPPPSARPEAAADSSLGADSDTPLLPTVPMVAYPVHDEADEVALLMLRQLLDPRRYEVELLPDTMLASEVVALLEQKQVGLLCLGSLAPGSMAQTRYLCKRLRARLPALKIVVGRWGAAGRNDRSQEQLRAAGADDIGTSLHDTCAQLMQLASLSPRPHIPSD